MNATQISAFKSAAGGPNGGYSPEVIATLIIIVTAAVTIFWGAYTFVKLAQEAQQQGVPITITRVLLTLVRAVVMVLIVLYMLRSN